VEGGRGDNGVKGIEKRSNCRRGLGGVSCGESDWVANFKIEGSADRRTAQQAQATTLRALTYWAAHSAEESSQWR
jgi:hypothetical protein